MATPKLIFTSDPLERLVEITAGCHTVVLTDTTCLPFAQPFLDRTGYKAIVIQSGETNKNLATVTQVWTEMEANGCTRRSMIVNFGGGVVTDLGGFAASTFKRGIPFVNVPTTLLAAVDASVGGKTGIDFNGLKNEIGVFSEAEQVVISTIFFATLPYRQLLSGYGEMIKHSLLVSEEEFLSLTAYDIASLTANPLNLSSFLPVLERSVMIKERIVTADPQEKGLRKVLNLGHTAGHAIESLSLGRGIDLPHGYAVAVGMVVALVLSHMRLRFPSPLLQRLALFVRDNYDGLLFLPMGCNDYPELLRLMGHDKKNAVAGEIAFTLLEAPGNPRPGCVVPHEEIRTALDITRDLLGI